MALDTPIWVGTVSSEYSGNELKTTYTELRRSLQSAQVFESCASYHGQVNSIGIIGVGFDASLSQSLHPHVLHASACNILPTAPSCTFVDIDPRVREVFNSSFLYGIVDTDSQLEAWQRFVALSGEQERIVKELDPDLPSKDAKFIAKYLLTDKVHAIRVPELFREGLRSGQISIVCADVSNDEWSAPAQLDYIDCSNLLNHLYTKDQKPAFLRMKKSLRTKGILMITDIDPPYGALSVNGGWLSEKELSELGFANITSDIHPPKSDMYVFQNID